MPSACAESIIMDTMKTLAATVEGLHADRIKLGVDDIGASTEFLQKFRTASITNKVLSGNVATITAAGHGYEASDHVTVQLDTPDTGFDGSYQLSAVTANTYSYARTNPNVASTAATGLSMHTPFLVITPAVRTGIPITPADQFTYDITAKLWFGYMNNTDYTFKPIQNILFPLLNAWQGIGVVENITSSPPELRSDLNPIVGCYIIGVSLRGCS